MDSDGSLLACFSLHFSRATRCTRGCAAPAASAPHKKVSEHRRDRRHACRPRSAKKPQSPADGRRSPGSCTGVTVAKHHSQRRRLDRFVVVAASSPYSGSRALFLSSAAFTPPRRPQRPRRRRPPMEDAYAKSVAEVMSASRLQPHRAFV